MSIEDKTNIPEQDYLTNVDDYKKLIKKTVLNGVRDKDRYKKNIDNISYNLKYLELLDQQLKRRIILNRDSKELVLDDVLKKNMYKNFVITSMEIINAILYLIFKEKGLDKEAKTTLSNKIKYLEETDSLGLNCYDKLHNLRKYRNKVHIIIDKYDQNSNDEENVYDTDWFTFDDIVYKEMKTVLKDILLNNTEDDTHEETLYFLD